MTPKKQAVNPLKAASSPLDLTSSIQLLELNHLKFGKHWLQCVKTAGGSEWIANPAFLSALQLNEDVLAKLPPEYKNSRCVRYQESNGQLHLWKYWEVSTLNKQGIEYLINLSNKITAKRFRTWLCQNTIAPEMPKAA